MGCFDIVCPFCNLPYNYGSFIDIPTDEKEMTRFIKFIEHLKKYKIFKNKNNKDIISFIKKYQKKLTWLGDANILFKNGKIIKKARETACNNQFNFSHYLIPDGEIIWIHDKCYNYINKKLGFKLELRMIPYNLLTSQGNFNISKTAPLKFLGQLFDYFGFINKYPTFFDKSFTKNKEIHQLIDYNLTLVKIPSNKIKTPLVHPSFLKNNTFMLGNDNIIYKINNNKWCPVKTKTKTTIIPTKKLNLLFPHGFSSYIKRKEFKEFYSKGQILNKKNFKIVIKIKPINKIKSEITFVYI